MLFDLAIEANNDGDYFPIHATCLGFEQLAVKVSGNCSILTNFSAEDAARGGQKEILDCCQVAPRDFKMSSELQSFFQATSVSEDKNKVPYISTVEAKQYPIIGTQWHPEKNLFEWTSTEAIPHGADAAKLAQRVANLLVDRARRSCHKPSPAEVEDLLIYNYSPVYPAKVDPMVPFDQVYLFEQPDHIASSMNIVVE
eukprot:gene10709-12668_t